MFAPCASTRRLAVTGVGITKKRTAQSACQGGSLSSFTSSRTKVTATTTFMARRGNFKLVTDVPNASRNGAAIHASTARR